MEFSIGHLASTIYVFCGGLVSIENPRLAGGIPLVWRGRHSEGLSDLLLLAIRLRILRRRLLNIRLWLRGVWRYGLFIYHRDNWNALLRGVLGANETLVIRKVWDVNADVFINNVAI